MINISKINIKKSLRDKLKLVSKILTVVFTFMFGITLVGGTILFENEDAVSSVMNIETQRIEEDPNAAGQDTDYYKSAFKSVEEVKANGNAYAETIVAEGATLLKNGKVQPENNENTLPLKKDNTVSLFSTSSVDPVISGTGSSGSSGESVSLKKGLESAGLKINDTLYDWYTDNLETYGKEKKGGTVGTVWNIGDAKWSQITTDAKNNEVDAAIFVLSRTGGEGIDSTMYGGDKNDFKDGNYLKLSPSERNVLEELNKLKGTKFKRIIVLMNTANQVECEFMDDPSLGIDALLWVGTYGECGAYAIGDILVGNVNPSGKLPDTFYKQHYLNPVNANYGTLVDESNDVTQWATTGRADKGKNIVYQEGIYMGYRYSETRYEDSVLGDKDNTGTFVYNDVISYPFGYGLSYTNFTYSDMKMERTVANTSNGLKNNTYTITLEVTNSGSVSGKEAVQIYLQKPYIKDGIEKAAVELVGFAKTAVLAPGSKEKVTIDISERDFASYDSYVDKTYVVDAGNYYLTAAKDSHDAVNNILAMKGKTIAHGMTANGNRDLVVAYEMDDKSRFLYSTAEATGVKITNQFDNVDLKLYSGAGDNANSFEYVTRNNWEGTVTYGLTADNERTHAQVKVTATQKMQEDLSQSLNNKVEGDAGAYPIYGSTKTAYTLVDLRAYSDDDEDPTNNEWLPYDDPMWNDLLDQLTWDETVDLLSHGFRKTASIASIAKPETIDHNGATGPVERYNVMEGSNINRGYAVRTNDPNKGKKPIVYPCNALVAATFNLELSNYYGRQWGEDCLWAGYSGLYGMGLDTHRSAYGGRNFEYYSEDPVLMGKIAAQTTLGMATRGVYVYLKHGFLNDQETYRCGGFTWANEQTCREIYLRSFQIAIEEGGAQSIMGGLNSLGMFWTGTHGFMNTVLRGEFGMTGHTVTDSYGCYNGSFVQSVMHGNDLPDGTVKTETESFDFASPKKGGYSNMAWAMRESAHRVLYTVVHSNAMNGFSSGTRVIKIVPWWKHLVTGMQIATGVLFGLSALLLGSMIYFSRKEIFGGDENEEVI